jgi:DNA-binding MarR family transcriptional regulator
VRGSKHDYPRIASFRAALRGFERAAEEAARAAGLTPQRYLLLLMVSGAPDGSGRTTVGALADRLQLAGHTVTGAVGRAVAAGLLAREPCPQDRRRTWISLTDEGERRLERVVDALTAQREELAAALDELLVATRAAEPDRAG